MCATEPKRSWTERLKARWVDHAVGLLLAAIYMTVVFSTVDDVGFSRDEGFYFYASEDYLRWFELLWDDPHAALTKASVDRYWHYNNEHPALMKELFALSYKVFDQKLHWVRTSTSFRIPGVLMSGLGLYLLFLLAAELAGRRAAWASVMFMALMPRFFYHSHLNCFDVPITTMLLATTYAYWRSLRSVGWGVATGAIWGVALCTKLNAMFVPPVLVFHYLVWMFWGRKADEAAGRKTVRFPVAFVSMAVLGPLIFLAHWPYIWWDTIHRVGWYIGFHQEHPFYNIAYFGYTIFRPPTPMSYPTVMTLITVPGVTLLLAFAGMGLRIRERMPGRLERLLGLAARPRDGSPWSADLMVGLACLWPIALLSLPQVPKFGGTKHWMPTMPFLALYAGYGFRAASDAIASFVRARAPGRKRLPGLATALLFALLAAAPFWETVRSHPFGLEYYTPLAGGAPGAADLGMCRQFWGYTTQGVVPWLNEHMPPMSRVYFHDTAWPSYRMYQRDGTLRKDILWSDFPGSRAAMVHHELHMAEVDFDIWTAFGNATPSTVLTYAGVPLISVYEPNGGYRTYWARRAAEVQAEEAKALASEHRLPDSW